MLTDSFTGNEKKVLVDFPLTPFIFAAEDIAFTFVSLFKKWNQYTFSVKYEVFMMKIKGSEEGPSA